MASTAGNPQKYELFNLSGTKHSFRWKPKPHPLSALPALCTPRSLLSLPTQKPMMSSDCHWPAQVCLASANPRLPAMAGSRGRHRLALSTHPKELPAVVRSWTQLSSGLSWLTVICHFLPFGHLFGHNFFNRWPQKWNQNRKPHAKVSKLLPFVVAVAVVVAAAAYGTFVRRWRYAKAHKNKKDVEGRNITKTMGTMNL